MTFQRRPMVIRRSHFRLLAILPVLFVTATGCGDDPVEAEVGSLAGEWEATELIISNQEDPDQEVDILAAGGSLFLNVEPSGYYTLSLTFQGSTPPAELGVLRTEGNLLIMDVQISPTGPRIDTATYSLSGDRLTLQGPTIFDFDLDAQAEDAWLDTTLERD